MTRNGGAAAPLQCEWELLVIVDNPCQRGEIRFIPNVPVVRVEAADLDTRDFYSTRYQSQVLCELCGSVHQLIPNGTE